MSDVSFSIITVTFNSEKYLRETMESVLNQNYDAYEYIIVDGGSTDNTISIIKDYEDKFNGKLRWISERDNGLYDAMNKGIRMSKGSFIGIINSDDYYLKDAFSTINEYVKSNSKAEVVHGNVIRAGFEGLEDIKFVGKGNSKDLKKRMSIMHPTCFIKKNVYDTLGFYDLNYKIAADYDLMFRLINNGVVFGYINKELAFYRLGGLSNKKAIDSFIEGNKIRFKYVNKFYAAYVLLKNFIKDIIRDVRMKTFIALFGEKKYTEIRKKHLLNKLDICK